MSRDPLTCSRCDVLPNVVSVDHLSLARESEAATIIPTYKFNYLREVVTVANQQPEILVSVCRNKFSATSLNCK